MTDSYKRAIDYMRVSITDRCNLRCRYCMPDGITCIPMEELLTLEEITETCRQAAELGICKIKITGGEPLVRLGCTDLVRMIKALPDIEQVTLTTNGVLLPRYAEELYRAGIDGVNVSLDTLDGAEYKQITGFDALSDVLEGITIMSSYRIPLKINSVLQRGQEDNWLALAELTRKEHLDVRFIEMMPIGYGRRYKPVSNTEVYRVLEKQYGKLEPDVAVHGNGPAVYYKIPGSLGSVGMIGAVHDKFCSRCNRIRLTSIGQIKPCLCYEEGISVKEALRSGSTQEVKELIAAAVMAKPLEHMFGNEQMVTETREMARIGG